MHKIHLDKLFGDRQAPDGSMVSDNFSRWFAHSSVCLDDGCPRVMYHGTKDDIDVFKKNKDIEKDAGWYGHGIYFTADPCTASAYSGYDELRGMEATGTPRVMPVYLSVQNPYTWPQGQQVFMDSSESAAFTEKLIQEGYDGIIVPNQYADSKFSSHYEVVVFDPSQIKSSTGNSGAFLCNSSDIADKVSLALENALLAKEVVPEISSTKKSKDLAI